MRGKVLSTTLLVLVITIGTMGILTVPPAYAAPEPVMKIVPSSISWSEPVNAINDTFTVDVVVENVAELLGWTVGLSWDPAVLECIAAGFYDDYRDAVQALGGDTLRINGSIGVGSFTTPYGEASIGLTPSDPFRLIYATFKAINYSNTPSVINFTGDTELRGPLGTITFDTEPGYFTFTTILVYEYDVVVADETYRIAITTNSMVSDFNFDETYAFVDWRGETSFNVTGPDGTTGFCDVAIPQNLTTGSWQILIDDEIVSFTATENATHTMLYFTYAHGATPSLVQIYGTWVVPEFSTPTLLMTLIIVALAIAILAKKAPLNKRRHLCARFAGYI